MSLYHNTYSLMSLYSTIHGNTVVSGCTASVSAPSIEYSIITISMLVNWISLLLSADSNTERPFEKDLQQLKNGLNLGYYQNYHT